VRGNQGNLESRRSWAKDEINSEKLPVIKKGFVFVPVSCVFACQCACVCVLCQKGNPLTPAYPLPRRTLNPWLQLDSPIVRRVQLEGIANRFVWKAKAKTQKVDDASPPIKSELKPGRQKKSKGQTHIKEWKSCRRSSLQLAGARSLKNEVEPTRSCCLSFKGNGNGMAIQKRPACMEWGNWGWESGDNINERRCKNVTFSPVKLK